MSTERLIEEINDDLLSINNWLDEYGDNAKLSIPARELRRTKRFLEEKKHYYEDQLFTLDRRNFIERLFNFDFKNKYQ